MAAHALVIGAGGLGSPVAAVPGHRRRRAASRWWTTTRWTSPTCSARSRTTWRASARPRRSPPQQAIARHQPGVAGARRHGARRRTRCWMSWWPHADVVHRLLRQLRHPPRGQRAPASGTASRWCPAPRSASTARSRVYDTARPACALLRLRVPARRSEFEETRCATMGVFAPLVGIIGAMQAAEALKLLSGAGPSLAGRLQMLDGRTMEWSEVRVPRNPACPVCANGCHPGLAGIARSPRSHLGRVR